MTETGDGLINQGGQLIYLADIGLQAQEGTACRGNLGDGIGWLDDIDADDITARLGQPQGHALSEASVTTCHYGHFACQIKRIENHGVSSWPPQVALVVVTTGRWRWRPVALD